MIINFLFIWVRLNVSFRHQENKLQSTSSQLNVTSGGTILAAKSTVKYLGIEIDQHLSGEYIARNAISNINTKVKFILCNAHFLI